MKDELALKHTAAYMDEQVPANQLEAKIAYHQSKWVHDKAQLDKDIRFMECCKRKATTSTSLTLLLTGGGAIKTQVGFNAQFDPKGVKFD